MESASYFQSVLALAFVIGLILFFAWAARRFGLGGLAPGGAGKKGRRLGIVEVAVIDAKRRLVLVRRDDQEHLLLIGGATDLVLETGIGGERFAPALARALEADATVVTEGATAP